MAGATLPDKTDLCENCYNPAFASCHGAKALGYGMRRPSARAIPDYLFEDIYFGRRAGRVTVIAL